MKKTAATIAFLIFLFASPAKAQECTPPPGGACLTADQKKKVLDAARELQGIHEAPATLEFKNPVEVIEDWDGRVYINGGSTNPIQVKLKIGDTIDRDLAVTLPSRVYYRPKPPDPMFRLRIRAQAGVLVTPAIDTAKGDKQAFWDGQVSFDFWHFDAVNFSVAAGIRSISAGPGVDLTKNFGLTAGYAFIYDGFKSTIFAGAYFSFN